MINAGARRATASAHLPARVRVVGNAGSGKTTLAATIARRLGVPHLELDAVFWDAGWTQRDQAGAQRLLEDFLTGPGRNGWVMDGNWERRLGAVGRDADLIVWLDHPRHVVMNRILRRTLGRGITRRELWHGNRERLGNLLRRDPEQNIVRWAWVQHETYRDRYRELAGTGAPVLRLRGPGAVRRWLRQLDT